MIYFGKPLALCIHAVLALSRRGTPGFGGLYVRALRRGPAAMLELWRYFEREWPAAAADAAEGVQGLVWEASR